MKTQNLNDDQFDLKKFLFRVFSFWPYIMFFCSLCILLAFLYLRYADYKFSSVAKIEIIDKAQDSEMALPTSMTIFNRSMINLQNEIGIITSFSLNERTIKKLNLNVKYFTVGRIKKTENHYSELFDDFDFTLDSDFNKTSEGLSFVLNINTGNLIVTILKEGEIIDSIKFDGLSTYNNPNNLPFNLIINSDKLKSPIENQQDRIIEIHNVEEVVSEFISKTKINEYGEESDQLEIQITHTNKKVAEDFLNTLIYEFDLDGITDRQLEYKRTMDFVDSRSLFLKSELEIIESKKKEFKKKNKLSDIKVDADISISQQLIYDTELFEAESQKELLKIIKKDLEQNNYNLLPINIGLNDSNINILIEQYNTLIKEKERFVNTGIGEKNSYILSLNNQLDNIYLNILKSIESFDINLDYKISNTRDKELEFEKIYKNIPENEKVLRSIERELEVKESLFLLLLQKREEAAINNAVVKPSVKVIDYAISTNYPVSPSYSIVILSSLFIGIIFPLVLLSIWFFIDNKIHIRDDILEFITDIPIVSEIPHLKNLKSFHLDELTSSNRSVFVESIRMLIANLSYISKPKNNISTNNGNVILVTSSIKGEGKTIVSSSISSVLCESNKKVILIGADLRNPQIHNYLGVDKNDFRGLSDYLCSDNDNWKDLLINSKGLDVILSGSIPPNPNELISSKKFINLIDNLKSKYDYIIIDSAPCLLVSDTLKISNAADLTLCIVRSNHTPKNIMKFIYDLNKEKKLNNLSIVLNSVGNSAAYGYKYGYQYSYNYGYGYGYSTKN